MGVVVDTSRCRHPGCVGLHLDVMYAHYTDQEPELVHAFVPERMDVVPVFEGALRCEQDDWDDEDRRMFDASNLYWWRCFCIRPKEGPCAPR